MAFMDLIEREEELRRVWAKSASAGQQGEGLVEHTYAVVGALAQIAGRYPALAQRVGEPRLWHRAFWSCWFHDLGKSAQGFQAALRPGGRRWSHRHEVLSLAFLGCFCRPESDDFRWIAAGILSHHKDAPVVLDELYNPRLDPADWGCQELAREIELNTWRTLQDWTVQTAPGKIKELGFSDLGVEPVCTAVGPVEHDISQLLVAGLTSYLGFWRELKKLPAKDRRNQAALALRGIIVLADHLASAHAPALDESRLPDQANLLSTLGLKLEDLFPHQDCAARSCGSIVLSAPTGSGKTEAALFWARKQQDDATTARPLIFLLPYQASLNAMHKRLSELLNRDVALIHAKSLQALYRTLMDSGYDRNDAERLARENNNFGRLHKPSVRVSSPYQLLKAAYRLKGYEGNWASLSDSLLVLDEVHAYEPGRLGLLFELLSELVSRWNVRVCAMTATMPSWLRKSLSTLLSASDVPSDPKLFQRFARHRIEILEGHVLDERIRRLAMEEFAAGRSVLLAANTVGTAQRLYESLRATVPAEARLLLHSRFAVGDRLEKESALLTRLSPSGQRRGPTIAVATQVVEVSLNLDFDTIITEPAPLEALLQRFGRVNRARRKGIVPVRIMTKSLHDEKIYDPELIVGSLSMLQRNDGCVLDEWKVSEWLDRIYEGEVERRYVEEIERNRKEFRESCLDSLRAFETDDALEEHFDSLFQGAEVLPTSKIDEYCRLRPESVLEAAQLLVPVSWHQVQRYTDRFVWNHNLKVRTADFPYDREYGLKVGA